MEFKELLVQMTDEKLLRTANDAIEVANVRGINLILDAGKLTVAHEAEAQDSIVTKESLIAQLPFAYSGYRSVIDILKNGENESGRFEAASPKDINNEFDIWFTTNKVKAAKGLQENDPDLTFTLVATPNYFVSASTIANAKRSHIDSESFWKMYTPKELSGTNPGNGKAVKFSLISNKHDVGMKDTVRKQRSALNNLHNKFKEVSVPSPLEAMTFFERLCFEGVILYDSNNFDKTYTRHFNLPEKRINGWTQVPVTRISEDRVARFDKSNYGEINEARLSIR